MVWDGFGSVLVMFASCLGVVCSISVLNGTHATHTHIVSITSYFTYTHHTMTAGEHGYYVAGVAAPAVEWENRKLSVSCGNNIVGGDLKPNCVTT